MKIYHSGWSVRNEAIVIHVLIDEEIACVLNPTDANSGTESDEEEIEILMRRA